MINLLKLSIMSTLFLFTASSLANDAKKPKKASAEQKFTMCAAIRMKEINLNHLKSNPEKYSTPIPEGWTVVSGTGGEGHPKLLLCK